jgi:hypothetical protein
VFSAYEAEMRTVAAAKREMAQGTDYTSRVEIAAPPAKQQRMEPEPAAAAAAPAFSATMSPAEQKLYQLNPDFAKRLFGDH